MESSQGMEDVFYSEPINDNNEEDKMKEDVVLFKFQIEATKWMKSFYDRFYLHKEIRGGVLSMPIGSGKTEVVLEFINGLKNKLIFILCPTSLINHWVCRIKRKKIEQSSIVCMGFEEFKTNKELHSKLYSSVDVWVVDEAHSLKNNKSIVYSVFKKQIDDNLNCFVWLVTATPFVNSLKDLQSLKSICLKENLNDSFDLFYQPNRLLIEKELSLPELKQEDVKLHFTFEQHKKLYNLCNQFINIKESLIFCEFLQRLSNHPFYIARELWRTHKWNELAEIKKTKTLDLFAEYYPFDIEFDLHPIIQDKINSSKQDATAVLDIMSNQNIFFESEKFCFIIKLLNKYDTDKIVIFSRYVWTLRLLQQYLSWFNVASERVDGSCENSKRRNKKLSRFKQGKKKRVLLCSSATCGIGLDFSFCSIAVLLEPFWNKALEDQALYRIYRFGQTKPCIVYKLVQLGTSDEYISSISAGKELVKFDLPMFKE